MNKLERLVWCLENRNRDFSHHLFADETMIRFFEVPIYHSRRTFPTRTTPVAVPSTSKHRLKVNICGGISSKGPTQFIVWFENIHYLLKCCLCAYYIKNKVFKNNMDAEFYDQIIRHTFFPFFIFNREIVHLHQDNDSKHSSNLCMNTMRDLNIDWASLFLQRFELKYTKIVKNY